jgi:hypothetical protein
VATGGGYNGNLGVAVILVEIFLYLRVLIIVF